LSEIPYYLDLINSYALILVFYTYRTDIFVKELHSEKPTRRVRGGIIERRGKKLEKCTREEPGGGVGVLRGGRVGGGGGFL
jgi:hypothetical protein